VEQLDRIEIKGLRAYGYVGVFPEEQHLGQWFEVDFSLYLHLRQASLSDDLNDSLDYGPLATATQELIRAERCQTLERLAGKIAEQLLAYPGVAGVQVRLTKLTPPIPDFTGQVSIVINRQPEV
jgi:dihydroneopterin aldolase